MFSIGGALNALQNTVGALPGNEVTARVGWNDPKTWLTPERRANLARMAANAPTAVYQRREIGGTEDPFTGAGSGRAFASGYESLGGEVGQRPRAPRTSMASLQRAAARGNPGWGVGGFK
jgi:hypothetical protein